jgi:protein gp37
MGENSKIEWCDHTMNFWVGCTKVSAACDFCYAESWAKRSGHPELWAGERRRTAPANWRQPYKWNAFALALTRRARVFTNSLADFFDNQVPDDWRADAWRVIDETRHLDWLILTKRPQNIAKMLPVGWGDGWSHVWLGTTCENQEAADRNIPALLGTPAAVRFVSLEPLLGPINLTRMKLGGGWYDVLGGWRDVKERFPGFDEQIDWVIVGGESGPNARPSHPDWFRSLRDQCAAADVPFHFKQWGGWKPVNQFQERVITGAGAHGVIAIDGRFIEDTDIADPPASVFTVRVGKKAAGRLLDGVEHNGMPGGGS